MFRCVLFADYFTMSSTYIIEPHENEKDSKKDDNFIIVINDDGTMAVDQETLQNLLSWFLFHIQ